MVSIGDAFVFLGAATALAAAVTRILSVRSGDKKLAGFSTSLSLLMFASVTGALLFLTYLFLTSDMDYHYVWNYSSVDLETMYKLSGVWAGAEGSFLLWIWLMALVLAVEVMLEPRRDYLKRKFHGYFQSSLALMVFLFILVLINMDLFIGTRAGLLQHYPSSYVDTLLAAHPDGYGLNLLLQTPEMVIHPPVVFAGYAFCVAAFSSAAAYFITGDRNWFQISLPWARLGWIFLTLGIGIGAIWAYYVLGWGGYWAWDPVETSSLLPWLIATAFLHTQVRHARKGEYGIVSPVLGMLSFSSVIFATFATRAGSIWASSVHAFGGSVGDTAADRMSYLLKNDSTVLGIFTLLLMTVAITFYMAYNKYRVGPRQVHEPEPDRISEYISDKNNMFLTVFLLVVTSMVMLLLLFKNVEVLQGPNYDEFNQKMSLFFVVIMVTMTVCLVWKSLGKETAFWLGSGLVVFSVLLAAVAVVTDAVNGLVAFSLPSYVVAVGASAFRLARSRVKGSVRKTLQRASPHVVHLGVALVLLSFVVSSTMQVYPKDLVDIGGLQAVQLDVDSEFVVGDFSIRLDSLTSRSDIYSAGGSTVMEVREAVMDISRSGDPLRSGVVLSDLYGLGPGGQFQVLEVEVYVYKAVLNDLYINFQWYDNNTAVVQAKVVPLMNPLWTGLGLLVVGLSIRTVAWQQEPKEEALPKKAPKAAETRKVPEPATKPEKDYEALVEEELRRYKDRKRS